MKRREFIMLIGSAIAAAPRIAHAQQIRPIRKVGYLSFARGSLSLESPRQGLLAA